ncbi:MAG: hypothetical protein ACFB2Z_09815 [Maricaulaceae bacterium]
MKGGVDVGGLARRIRALQRADGAIDWVEDGIWDPWNQIEAAMGLSAAGDHTAAERSFDALADRQAADGSWLADMGAAAPMDRENRRLVAHLAPKIVDTNFAAYIGVGLAYCARAKGDLGVLRRHAETLGRAMDFVLACQHPSGEIAWRRPEPGEGLCAVDALFAANCAIQMSLDAAAWAFDALGRPRRDLAQAAAAIRQALAGRPERFDRSWSSKTRYAMDWYYPVLTGVLSGQAARARLARGWDTFVVAHLGCRCGSDQPWVTAAETAELAIACAAAGAPQVGRRLIQWLEPLRDPRGGYWMGYQLEDGLIWPQERPSWTAGAVLLAWDVLEGLTPGAALFRSPAQSRTNTASDPVWDQGANRPDAAARVATS